MPPHMKAPALVTPDLKNDLALGGGSIYPTNNLTSSHGQLVDRHGHHLSEAVLVNWSPQMLQILGVRRDGGAS